MSGKTGERGAPTNLIHCSYHKCLTVYFRRVMDALFNRCLRWTDGYRHYNSHLDEFYDGFRADRLSSINNRALDLHRLGRVRISRFVRDPRDLVVSGYFYHRRGAEAWTRTEAPTADDWYFANGVVPAGMRGSGLSFTAYLQSLPEEEGLLAELEFRQLHFESMSRWPAAHPDIATFRYEEILGNEVAVFLRLCGHYGLSRLERTLVGWFARRWAVGGPPIPTSGIRGPASGGGTSRRGCGGSSMPTTPDSSSSWATRLTDGGRQRHGSLVARILRATSGFSNVLCRSVELARKPAAAGEPAGRGDDVHFHSMEKPPVGLRLAWER